MSAPIPMPLPYPNSIIHHHHQPSPIDTAHTVNSQVQPNPLSSHSNQSSAQASSVYPLPSTAGTSPVSNFQVNNHQPGLMVNNPNSVTRILILSDFNKDLKTRDIQLVFAEWEDERGGFKFKWIDDTSCLIVFADPGVAKRAFLTVLSNPPPSLTTPLPNAQPGPGKAAKLRAYNGSDVMHILASVQNRPRSRSNASQSLHSRASSLASTNNGLVNGGLGRRPSMGTLAGRHRASLSAASNVTRSQAPPSISATGSPAVGPPNGPVNLSHPDDPSSTNNPAGRARIDDAGKRFIAAGLGKNNSAISHLPVSKVDETANSVGYSLANLTIEEEATTPTASSH